MADFINVYNNYLKTFVDKGPAYLARAAAVLEYDGDTEDTFGRHKVKTPPKSKSKRSKMASNKNGSHDNGPPGGSAADSANNNIRNTGKVTSQLSTETEGTLSTCSTLDRYMRGDDRHVSNSDFEDMCKANDLSDTDTLTGSPHVRSPVAPNGKFPSTGLNIAKDFISPSRQDDPTNKDYLQQLDDLINEPLSEQREIISATTAHDTIGQINMDYFAQLDAPTGPPKGRKDGRPEANGKNKRHEDISSRVDQDTMDLLAQLDSFGPRPTPREVEQTVFVTSVKDTIGGVNRDYLAELEESTISVTSVQDTIGTPNLDYLAQLEAKQNDNRHQASNRLSANDLDCRKLAKSPVQKTVIKTATGNSPERSPVFTRRTSGGILGRVNAFENLQKRLSGCAVKEDAEVKAAEKEFEDYPGFTDFRELEERREREAEERLDSLGPEEDEEERNKSVRDAISIFERFKSSLGQVKETPRPAGKSRPDAFEKHEGRPDAHGKSAPKQEVGSRPALRPQQAFERSFDFDSSSFEQEKQKTHQTPKKEDRDSGSRKGQGQKVLSIGVNENNSDRSRVKFRSSSADRFSDPNRQNLSKKRDVSPRFSPKNAADPEDERRRLKNRSQSGDRIRPKSEYRAQEEARRGQETYVLFAKDQPRPRGRQSRKDERGRAKDRNADKFVKSDPEFTYTSDEMERYHDTSPLPPRDDLKRRSGFERHLEQPPLSPVKEVRPISGHYDNQLSPPPPFDPRRRSGSYERQPALIVSPQPGERRSGSYDRPQSGMALSPHVPYPDLKRWSGNYDRQGRPEGPPPGPPPVPVRAMPRVPPGFERDYRIPPYRDSNQYPERRDSPLLREDRGSPYMHDHGPGSPRCFSPQQRPYGEREGSPKCFSPRQWPNQERDGGRGSPHFSPHHRPEGYHQRQEDDPIYARVQKTNRPYYGPAEPGTYYMHDRPEQWQRNPHYEQRYYDNRAPAFRYPPYQGYSHDPYMRHSQDYPHRDWDYQDRSPYSMNYPPPLEVCPYHHPTDPRSYHEPLSPKNVHPNEQRSYHEQPSPKNLHHGDPRGYQEPLSPKHMHQSLNTPYDNVDNLGPLRNIPQHVRGPSPTGYHSDDPMYLRKMNEYVHRQQTQLSQQQTQSQEQPQPGDSRNFYSDFHPGDPYRQEQEQKNLKRAQELAKPREWKYGVDSNFQADPYRPEEESTEWKYAHKQEDEQDWTYEDDNENEGQQTTDSAFHRYLPEDDPFAQLNPTNRAPDLAEMKHGQIGSFDSDMIPSYSDLPDQEAVQAQDPLDQYMSPPRQMKLKPKHVKKEKDAKKAAPLAVKLDTHFDRSDTMRSTSTNTSTLKSFATDTIGSSKSWGKYDPFVNPSAFAPELGLELMPKWSREDRDKTPTRSGPPPQRSLSDPSETESSKAREIRPYGRSRTSPGAVPNITVNSPSPAGQTKGTNMNRDVWVQLEARHPQRAPPVTSSSNLSKIEIASSVVDTKTTTPPSVEKTNSWQYSKGYGEEKGPKGAPVEKDILKEKGVFFSQPKTDASGVKKNFDEFRGPELSRKKLIYRKSHSDTRIPITKPERPKTLNIQHEFSKPDADLKRIEWTRFRDHRVKQLTDSALAVKCDTGHVEVKRELQELSSSRGAKIAGIKSAMFDANGKKEVIIHPLPVKSQNIPVTVTSFNGRVSYSQGLIEDEYLINVTKETKVKKTPFIQDHLAELEGLFQELDLDNENLLANAERQELKVNLLTQGDNLIKSLGPLTIDVGDMDTKDDDEPMPSLEYARKWLAEENERILNDAADFESMLDNAFEGRSQSNDLVVEKGSEQFVGSDLKLQHSDSSSVISDTRSAPCGSVNVISSRPLFPRKIADDVLTRRLARSNSSSSVPALPPVSPMSFLNLAQSLSPSESADCTHRKARSRSRTPDPVLDDINFRKIYRSISQPGIDHQVVKAKPSPTTADYLRERTTEPLRQLRLRVTNTADMYHDDFAYRRLRKDVPNLPTDVVSLRQRSRSLDNIKSQGSPILRHSRPPDGKVTPKKISEIKTRRIRKTSLSKGVGNLVDLFDSSEDSGSKSVMRQSHSLPDLTGYRTELSVDFDDRGNIVSADPKYVQHARHPKKTPRAVKMKSRLRQKFLDSMDDSETGDSGERSDCGARLQSNLTDSSDNPTSDGGLSGSEDASHEFEIRSTSLTSQSHDSDRTSDLETKRSVVDVDSWGKQGAERFKRSPVIEPDVFIPRKQTDEKIKSWYKSHKESFDKRFAYFESDCKDLDSTRPSRYRISLRKSASQDNLSGAKVELQTRVQGYPKEAEHVSEEKAKRPATLRMTYGSDPCLSEGRSRPPKHSDNLNQFRSILHFTVPSSKKRDITKV